MRPGRALFAFACSVLAQPAYAKPPTHLPEPGYLPAGAKMLLHSDMQRHAAQMSTLMSSTLLLDYETIGSVAHAIATEPRIARPTSHDATELNSRLPERFFALQDRLHAEAGRLAAAAEARDAAATSSAYGALAETCVACHASYEAGNAR